MKKLISLRNLFTLFVLLSACISRVPGPELTAVASDSSRRLIPIIECESAIDDRNFKITIFADDLVPTDDGAALVTETVLPVSQPTQLITRLSVDVQLMDCGGRGIGVTTSLLYEGRETEFTGSLCEHERSGRFSASGETVPLNCR